METPRVDGGDLIVVFKRKKVKYTMIRMLGVAPSDSQTHYRGPVRNNTLSVDCLESMLERAINAFKMQCQRGRGAFTFGLPATFELDALSRFTSQFVATACIQDDKSTRVPSF